jgi:DNA-binding CsgD family transcriptional regulator
VGGGGGGRLRQSIAYPVGAVYHWQREGMTIGELLATAEGDRTALWQVIRSELLSCAKRLCSRIGWDAAEAEEIAEDGLERVARRDFAPLHAARGQVLLSAWARGVARNVLRERMRIRRPAQLDVERVERLGTETWMPSEGWETLDLSALTPKELLAVRSRISGRSDRESARTLGISRSTFRDRIKRAIRRLKRIHGVIPPLPPMSRAWAWEVLHARPPWLKPRDRRCLVLYAEGGTRGEIGRSVGLSANGVKCVLRALRRRHGLAHDRRAQDGADRGPERDARRHAPPRGQPPMARQRELRTDDSAWRRGTARCDQGDPERPALAPRAPGIGDRGGERPRRPRHRHPAGDLHHEPLARHSGKSTPPSTRSSSCTTSTRPRRR